MPTPIEVTMTRDTVLPSTPGGAGAPASPRPSLQDHLQAAQAQPFDQNANANITTPANGTGAQPVAGDSVQRLSELEAENERLRQAQDRMRGQVSQKTKAEEEMARQAQAQQSEMVALQKQLAEAMAAMAQANTPDPTALSEDEMNMIGHDNIAAFGKLMDHKYGPLVDEIRELRAQVSQNHTNITNHQGEMSEDKIRLITAQQTMEVNPEVVRAKRIHSGRLSLIHRASTCHPVPTVN